MNTPRNVAGSLVVVAALVISGCSSSNSSASAPPSDAYGLTTQAELAAALPQAIQDKGKITIATAATFPPMESYAEDNTTIVGADVDMMNAMAKVWGVEIELIDVPFDQTVSGMAAGKYDLGWTPTIITEERVKKIDMVTYLQDASVLLVGAGNDDKDLEAGDLCGKRIGVEKGGAQESVQLPALSQKCIAAGKPAIEPVTLSALNQIALSLDSGRIEAGFAGGIALASLVEQAQGKYEIVGPKLEPYEMGIQTVKGSGVAQALVKGLDYLKSKGVYEDVLKKYGIEDSAVSSFAVAQPQNANGGK